MIILWLGVRFRSTDLDFWNSSVRTVILNESLTWCDFSCDSSAAVTAHIKTNWRFMLKHYRLHNKQAYPHHMNKAAHAAPPRRVALPMLALATRAAGTQCLLTSLPVNLFNILSWEYLSFYRGWAINRCADASNPRPRCARAPPLAINRSQRVGLINRALNYCISRHNNEVSSFRKNYGHHVGGRRGLYKPSQIIAYKCI